MFPENNSGIVDEDVNLTKFLRYNFDYFSDVLVIGYVKFYR